jgi:hypothetical protein
MLARPSQGSTNPLAPRARCISKIFPHKVRDLLSRHFGLRSFGNPRGEIVWHTFVDIELDRHTGGIQGLVEANKIAQEYFLGAALNKRWGKAFAEVAVHRRRIGIFLIVGVGPRSRSIQPLPLPREIWIP